MGLLTRCILLLLVTVTSVWAFATNQLKIPNGNNVPHSCKPNYLWHGVGHKNPLGSGPRNPFGQDFERLQQVWTEELCRMDSDGDGIYNGKELGDPDCTWKRGTLPKYTKGITHPGICDPWGSDKCKSKNEWVTCDTGEFDCDAIKTPDVRNTTLRFPKTKVPNTETNYYCMSFELPGDQDYHMIAFKPAVDNIYVMHHALMFWCEEGTKPTTAARPCQMSLPDCFKPIGGWTVGVPGYCIDEKTGFKFGKSGKRVVALEFHWNNPERRDDFYDSSGLTIYYTPKLRQNNAAALWVGQTYLKINPGVESKIIGSTCTSACTQKLLKAPINIFATFNHMHYLGIQESVTLYRNGRKIVDLSNDTPFRYDSPSEHYHKPAQVMYPGDVIKTSCEFRSISRKVVTYFGDGTAEEMCFGFVSFYPDTAVPQPDCVQWKNVDICEFYNPSGLVRGCYGLYMMNGSIPETRDFFQWVVDRCPVPGQCSPRCKEAVGLAGKESCFQGELGEYMLHSIANPNLFGIPATELGKQFVSAMLNCKA